LQSSQLPLSPSNYYLNLQVLNEEEKKFVEISDDKRIQKFKQIKQKKLLFPKDQDEEQQQRNANLKITKSTDTENALKNKIQMLKEQQIVLKKNSSSSSVTSPSSNISESSSKNETITTSNTNKNNNNFNKLNNNDIKY
jgi:hypothetical protein